MDTSLTSINSNFFPPSSNFFSLQIPLEFCRITSPARNELPSLRQYSCGLFLFLVSVSDRWLSVLSWWEGPAFFLPLMQVPGLFHLQGGLLVFVLYCVACIQFPFPFNWTWAEQPLSVYVFRASAVCLWDSPRGFNKLCCFVFKQ